MSNNQIPNCCVTRIHESLVDLFNFEECLSHVAYLSCNHCGNSYRFTVESCESLRPEINRTRHYVVGQRVVDIEGNKEMEAGFKSFVIAAETEDNTTLEFIYDYEETEEFDKLNKEVD